MGKNMVLITYDQYPNGNAGAVRQHVFAKAYMELGYTVTVIGMGISTQFAFSEFEGVKYISLRHEKTDALHKIQNKLLYKKKLKKILKSVCADAVMVIDIPLCAMQMVKKYTKKKNIPLIHDSVEWYSKEEFALRGFDHNYLHKDALNRRVINQDFRVIAISSYLQKHFEKKGIMTRRIPFVFDVANIAYEKELDKEKIVIVYAGSMGKKDYFAQIIDGLSLLLPEELSKFEFRILGITREGFINLQGDCHKKLEYIGNALQFLGRVPRETVIEHLKEASFTILLRPDNLRYAKAGFPTKVSESLTYGTPVITNLTSDLHLYLKDGVNSLIAESLSAESVAKTLRRALALDGKTRQEMCYAARETAEKELDYRQFQAALEELAVP
ncbi:MAG: glycosyltransferase [Clostridia bacterium]|nr:glycosyltransferase [Clostridia bacterium]